MLYYKRTSAKQKMSTELIFIACEHPMQFCTLLHCSQPSGNPLMAVIRHHASDKNTDNASNPTAISCARFKFFAKKQSLCTLEKCTHRQWMSDLHSTSRFWKIEIHWMRIVICCARRWIVHQIVKYIITVRKPQPPTVPPPYYSSSHCLI